MVGLPTYDPGGTQRTQAQSANNASPDAFGAGVGRALAGLGQQGQRLGGELERLQLVEKERQDTAEVIDATTQASRQMRDKLYGDGGIYTRTGANANGITEEALKTADDIRNGISERLTDPRQKAAFDNMWSQRTEAVANAAAGHEMKQREAYQSAAKTSALANLTEDVISNYRDEEMLGVSMDEARRVIRANPDGLPPEMVAQMERESISALHLSVIQRLALDDPGMALDYYTRHKGGVAASDHTKATALIKDVSTAREARGAADEIAAGGSAGDIVRSMMSVESNGDPAALSDAGASGLMQLMPNTARAEASALQGMGHIADMTDDELQAHWKTPQGQKDNIRVGTIYFNKQLKTFGGDLEAAVIAYNAGPANAKKWLENDRDYSVLPKPEETLPHVQKVIGKYKGVAITGNTSADIQAALKGRARSQYFQGDAAGFLKGRLQKQHGPQSIDVMNPALQDRLAGMLNDAPDFVKDGLDILSGARTHARQVELWNQSDKTGHRVARPGNSKHEDRGEGGEAADLGWNGKAFSTAPKEVRDWVHANAKAYGLTFPLGHEPWHIETVEARGGQAAKRDRPTKDDAIDARASDRVAQAAGDGNLTVGMAVEIGNPADIYAQSSAPFSVAADTGNLDTWLEAARDKYADNPSMLAEVERQLTEEHRLRSNSAKAQVDTLTRQAFSEIVGGASVRDMPPSVLQGIGPEGVSKLITIEGKFKGGDDETDEATYYGLSRMKPEEFAATNLLDYADKLSKADLKSFADKQATFTRNGGDAQKRSTDMTRTQIVGMAENIMGLKPSANTDDAIKMAALNRALNAQIEAHIAATGKEPDGVTMQKMVDDLMLEGKASDAWLAGDKRVFELTPEERSTFVAIDDITELPPEAAPTVATGYAKIWQQMPDETAAVGFYNDMARVKLGGAPVPPAPLETKIRQGLARAKGRAPTAEEIAVVYREMIIRATAKDK